MGGGEENREREHFPVQMNGAGRDLFFFGNHFPRKLEKRSCDGEEDEDIELSLGLSMNGRFGVDPKRSHEKLTRSSSISNFIVNRDDNNNARSASGAVAYAPLTRTCSLPAETEEEWGKRKELQTLRRMEAKRKRMEKLKNVRVMTDKAYLEDNLEENGQGLVPTDKNGFLQVPAPQLSPQGSVGSLGSGSSGIYDFENQPLQGVNKDTQMIIPNPVKTLAVKLGQNPETQPVTKNGKPDNSSGAVFKNSSMKVTAADHEGKEMLRNVLVDMPCVSTKGKGSHGKKIEGFLYRYRKEEEVKIVCVCHGSFLSPAEFVKHAGGGDVAHPLRHIVVNPSPFCNGGEPLC